MAQFLGFFPKRATKKPYEAGNASQAQIQIIIGIYNGVTENKSELGVRKFIKCIIGKMPLYLESLTIKEAQKVIIALKEWQKRVRSG